MSYIARRLGHALLLVAAVSFLCFLFADLSPGDFYSELRFQRGVSNQTIAEMRSRAGFDRPLPVRYALWAASAVRGEWGYSLAHNSPVGPLLAERLRTTLLLTATAAILSWLIAVPWGVWTAVSRGRWPDAVSRFVIAALLVIPDLLIALAFLAFAAASGSYPVGGMRGREYELLSTSGKLRDLAWHLALPVAVLVLAGVPVLVRHVRAAVVEVLDAPFALNARALGISRSRLLFRHLLPAAMNPLISLLGLSLGTLLSASLLVEIVMGWPGLGPLFIDAIMARDFAIVVAVVVLSTLFLVLGNLTADLLLYRFDPRIRARRP
jgi:peptide/nickel transport system permease protein